MAKRPNLPMVVGPTLSLADVGMIANRAHNEQSLPNYQGRKTAHTLQAQKADLALFVQWLASGNISVGDLLNDMEAWRGIERGHISAFLRWQMEYGYALATINRRLATLRQYVLLAQEAGVVGVSVLTEVQAIKGYRRKEARNRDAQRTVNRVGEKKGEFLVLTNDQITALKDQPDTLKGRRDLAMLCIFLDLGLRCGELIGLKMSNFDMRRHTITLYREKIDITQTHEIKNDASFIALQRYMRDRPASGSLWYHIRDDGTCVERPLTQTLVYRNIHRLGKAIDIPNLGVHDLRHTWATVAVQNGTDLYSLQQAGGWSSPAMPIRYIENYKIANQGVK